MAPVWKKETVLGPVPVRLDLSPAAREILATAYVDQLNNLIHRLETQSFPQSSTPLTLWQKLRATLARWLGR